MADCSQLAELYEAFALGALDPGEDAELRVHLARGCAVCVEGVARARETVANLAYLAPPLNPPAELRGKIMDAVRMEAGPAVYGTKQGKSSGFILTWAWAAAAAVLLTISIYTTVEMRRAEDEMGVLAKQAAEEQTRTRALEVERQRYRDAMTIMASAPTKEMALKPTSAEMPAVTAYYNPKMGLVLEADKMPDMPATRTLQLWVVPREGKPISAGMFRPDASGKVLMVMPPNEQTMNIAKALAISDEPAGGSPQPTSAPEWVGPVG